MTLSEINNDKNTRRSSPARFYEIQNALKKSGALYCEARSTYTGKYLQIGKAVVGLVLSCTVHM